HIHALISTPRTPDTRPLPSFPTRRSSDLRQLTVTPQHSGQIGLLQLFAHHLVEGGGKCIQIIAPQAHARRHRMAAELRQQAGMRSEEHTSELQSRENLVCRLLLEKKKRSR